MVLGKKCTVKNVMEFTICLLFNVVWKLKTGFSKNKSIYFTLEIKLLNAKFYIWVISPIIDKRLYLTLFDLATTSQVFTITKKNTTWIFSDFFKAFLTTLYTHRIIEFSKTLISNYFLLGLWISKKMSRRISM